MATDIPQRDLRNHTAQVLRRVQRGERLRITVHGHPVAELAPVGAGATFVSREDLIRDFKGLLLPDDDLERQLREADEQPRDPFA
jgi:prevent-host-death family protein